MMLFLLTLAVAGLAGFVFLIWGIVRIAAAYDRVTKETIDADWQDADERPARLTRGGVVDWHV